MKNDMNRQGTIFMFTCILILIRNGTKKSAGQNNFFFGNFPELWKFPLAICLECHHIFVLIFTPLVVTKPPSLVFLFHMFWETFIAFPMQ